MTITALQQAATAHMEGVSGLPPIVWPNDGNSGTVPRVEVSEGPVRGTVTDLNGDADSTWLLQVKILVQNGVGPGELQGYVQTVNSALPVGLSLGGGYVSEPVFPTAYMQDDDGYAAMMTVILRKVL